MSSSGSDAYESMPELVDSSDTHESMPDLVDPPSSDDDSIMDHIRSSSASSSDESEWFGHPDQLGATARLQNAVVGFAQAIVTDHHAPAGLQNALLVLLGELVRLESERAEASEARRAEALEAQRSRMRNRLARGHLVYWAGAHSESDMVMWMHRDEAPVAPAGMPEEGQAAVPEEFEWSAGPSDRMPAIGGGRVFVAWPVRSTEVIQP